MATRKPLPADNGITITPGKIVLWGSVVAAVATMTAIAWSGVEAVDNRYLLRTTGEKYQISNCVRFESNRQQTVEDAIFRLETQREEAQRDKRVSFNAADRQTLQRWVSQRRSEDQIKAQCIQETREKQ